jgi:hypothetical protein
MLMAMVLSIAMSLLAAGALVATSKYLSATNQATSSMGLSSCAQAVRQYIAAQSAAGSMATLSLTVPSTGTPVTLQGGHYENINAINFTLPSSPSSFGTRMTTMTTQNLANALPMSIGGGSTTTGTAVCTDSNGRTYEVEFSLAGP